MAEVTYKKETSNYNDSINNYVAPDEITVTITLKEYRELVATKTSFEDAKAKLTNEKYAMQSERDELKRKLEGLSEKLLGLTSRDVPNCGYADES